MNQAKDLIRTTVRTFYGTRPVLVVDALMVHSVLNAEDLSNLLNSQPKDIRRLVGPLRSARIVKLGTRNEAKVGSNRPVTREYYYIPFHEAIDAIKYRVMMLIKKIEETYRSDTKRKDWRCLNCKAEWEELEVLDRVGPDGFECHRCGHTLVRTEQAKEPAGGHEKLRRLNIQLKPLQALIEKVDLVAVPENSFTDALERKVDVPAKNTGRVENQYIILKNQQNARRPAVEQTDAAALNINLTSGAEQEAQEEARRQQRRAELAAQNQLPAWHTASVASTYGKGVKSGDTSGLNGGLLKKEESDEKKPDLGMQDDLAAYLAEMQREKEEAALKAAEEDAEEDDEDDDEFEDVPSTTMGTPLPGTGTPASSQQAAANGVKRELDSDSGISSEANTPAVGESPAKRVKFENRGISSNPPSGSGSAGIDSEDEEDFEDAM